MIKKVLITFTITLNILILFSCQTNKAVKTEFREITTDYGSYEVPLDWVKVDQWSNANKYFYAKLESKESETPTNISVEKGRNPYSLEEHENFRYAILKQLSMQLARSGDKSQLAASGTFTINNYPLYIFTIDDKETVKTVQFYIVGDKKHILIHVTEFYNDITDVYEIAKEIADSFIWFK